MIKGKTPVFMAFLALFSLLPILGSSLLFTILLHHSAYFESLSVAAMALFYVVMIFTMTAALTPTTFVAFVSGYLFSWAGFPMMIVAYLISSFIGLYAGKHFSEGWLTQLTARHPRWKLFVSSMENKMFMLVFFARLSPVMPFAMVNIALSALRLNRKEYFFGTLTGMLPRTFLFFWIGKNAVRILSFFENPSGEGLYRLIPVLLVCLSLAGILLIVKRSWNETKP